MPTEPRIMFVTRKWAPAVGGMETYSMRLTEALREIEAVDVVALAGRADGMPPSALALLLFPFTVLKRLLSRRVMPEVLHIGDMALWPLGLFVLTAPTRILISAHGTDVAFHRRGGLKGRLYGAYLRLGARLMQNAKIIANSRATAKVLAETGWTSSAIVPLASDLRGPAPDGTHNGRLLFVGRLVKRKGLGWFVREVLPLLPDEIEVDVAGNGWDESETACLSNPQVRHLGSLRGNALVAAYREALCVVIPNIAMTNGEYEGFGLVAPEAAACGGVVLAADCDGLQDAVRNGETGWLVPSGDAADWAEKIAEALAWTTEERKRHTASVAQAAKAYYNWQRVARETLQIYRD